MSGIVDAIKSSLISDGSAYPAVRVDEELYDTFTTGIAAAEADSGPRLRVRPPRENLGMDASISLYETIHDPHERSIGLGRHRVVTTKAHVHSHEMVYDEGKLQFFFKPDTRVDANQFERQLRKNYPNAQISEATKQFPTLEHGDYISMAKMRLKRPFYYPIKCKIAEEDFEVDPYGDITSDMVVEEDQTSTGHRVAAEDCRVMVQTIFEPARDVWTKRRPYGRNVTDAAAKIKEGEVVGNMVEGFEVRDPGAKRSRTAKIIDKLHGAKGYYFTVRVLAISPYQEIAERRCNTVASDFEKYYNSFTEQGLEPVAIQPNELGEHLRQMAERTHSIPWLQRVKLGPGQPAVLQTVSALGSIAHIPSDDINTPVVDWAKQQTGPGIPAESKQESDVTETETEATDRRKTGFNRDRADAQTKPPGGISPRPNPPTQTDEPPAGGASGGPATTPGSPNSGANSESSFGPEADSDTSPETDEPDDGPNFRTPPQATPPEEHTAGGSEPAGGSEETDEGDGEGENGDGASPWSPDSNRRNGY